MAAIYLFVAILTDKCGCWRRRALKMEGKLHLGSVFGMFSNQISVVVNGDEGLASWRWLPLTAYLFVWAVCQWVFQSAGQSVWLHFFRVCCRQLCFVSALCMLRHFHFVHYGVVCFTLFVNILFSDTFVDFFTAFAAAFNEMFWLQYRPTSVRTSTQCVKITWGSSKWILKFS